MSMLLNIEDLRFSWPGDTRPVLAMDSLALTAGEKVFMFGPSGSGKSTLLALIGGLVRPQAGRILFQAQDLTALGGARRDRIRAEHLGVIFQQFNLLPWLDLKANVMLPCRFSRARAARAGDVGAAAQNLLGAMGLDPVLWGRRADRLSVGQQQRVAAARALIGRPALILADEPTSALDHDRRQDFLDLLFGQVEAAGSTLLFVSHDRELAGRFDRAVDLTELNQAGVAA
ncbi:ABC transporter ATP-binding protein [Wenzhouxiangella limi]|uniref:ABC transporter ATP-binding protein n=1 Tax=Wenzhouxiangella limi TaxID=2707351 RepID=A0A845V1K8_9GAMM|nr:ABC transporter ATP-binding protein [Wenzhouxiangella limi]NDY95146.1 ABC transporter ATP-binding protein [Wenzhouxiangella limi]